MNVIIPEVTLFELQSSAQTFYEATMVLRYLTTRGKRAQVFFDYWFEKLQITNGTLQQISLADVADNAELTDIHRHLRRVLDVDNINIMFKWEVK